MGEDDIAAELVCGEHFCEVAEVYLFKRADAVDARRSHRRLIESAAAEESFGVGCFEIDDGVKDGGEFLPEGRDVDVSYGGERGFEPELRRPEVFGADEFEEFAVPSVEDSGGFGEEVGDLLMPVCGGIGVAVCGGAGMSLADFGEEVWRREVHCPPSCSAVRRAMISLVWSRQRL